MKNSGIEWTDHTFNPWIGCTKVSPGCANCYAEARDLRFAEGKHWGKGAPRQRTASSNWSGPIGWNHDGDICDGCGMPRSVFEMAQKRGGNRFVACCPERSTTVYRRPRVFCASLGDWLDDEVPVGWLADLLGLVMRTPALDWQLLTKLPENWRRRLNDVAFDPNGERTLCTWLGNWLDGFAPLNVWIGTSVEDQKRADKRIPELLKIPARIRFLSCEPLLEAIDVKELLLPTVEQVQRAYANEKSGWPHVHWVICGGESGQNKRRFDCDWGRSLRDQCKAAGVAFFFKQADKIQPIPEDLLIRQFPVSRDAVERVPTEKNQK